jgi:hypothetical protein
MSGSLLFVAPAFLRRIKCRRFRIGLEIMAAGGSALRVSEVPITFSDRTRGASKVVSCSWRLLAGA